MIRTQISLTEDQMRRAKSVARRRGISLAALLRASLDRELARDGPQPPMSVSELRGRYSSGATDVAERHDEYLGDGGSAGW